MEPQPAEEAGGRCNTLPTRRETVTLWASTQTTSYAGESGVAVTFGLFGCFCSCFGAFHGTAGQPAAEMGNTSIHLVGWAWAVINCCATSLHLFGGLCLGFLNREVTYIHFWKEWERWNESQ